jgi:hypothetical protein
MSQYQQRQIDAQRRAQGYLDSRTEGVGPLNESEGRKKLDGALTWVATLRNEQGTADRELAGQTKQEQVLVAELKTRHMQAVATFARARLRGEPAFAALTKPLTNLSPQQLVQAARSMATAAGPHADALVRGGFPADHLAQLGAAADALEAVAAARADTKVRRVAATKGIAEAIQQGREGLSMLHAVITHRHWGDPTFLSGWRAARRVVAKRGAPRAVAGAFQPAPVVPASARVPEADAGPTESLVPTAATLSEGQAA